MAQHAKAWRGAASSQRAQLPTPRHTGHAAWARRRLPAHDLVPPINNEERPTWLCSASDSPVCVSLACFSLRMKGCMAVVTAALPHSAPWTRTLLLPTRWCYPISAPGLQLVGLGAALAQHARQPLLHVPRHVGPVEVVAHRCHALLLLALRPHRCQRWAPPAGGGGGGRCRTRGAERHPSQGGGPRRVAAC